MRRAVGDEKAAPQSALTCRPVELALETQAVYVAELMPAAGDGASAALTTLAQFGDEDIALPDTATAFSIFARAGDGAHDELVVTTERHMHVMRSVPGPCGWRLIYVVLRIGRGTLVEALTGIRRRVRRPARRSA